jgi:hypothetical protein
MKLLIVESVVAMNWLQALSHAVWAAKGWIASNDKPAKQTVFKSRAPGATARWNSVRKNIIILLCISMLISLQQLYSHKANPDSDVIAITNPDRLCANDT